MLWLLIALLLITIVLTVRALWIANAEKVNLEASLAESHGARTMISDGKTTIGLCPEDRTIVIVNSLGDGKRYAYDHVAAVELTPIYTRIEEGSSETRTNRGSQIISAGVGGVVAGPVGVLVGGLSGSSRTTYESSSKNELTSMEIKLRLYDDAQPVLKIAVGSRYFKATEHLAALLANAIDLRAVEPRNLPAPSNVSTTLLTNSEVAALARDMAEVVGAQRGWFRRTFGA